jgi:hypothetical protein
MPRGPLGAGPKVDERIVILDIDEKSLGEIGRWPWSRGLMADLVTKLFDKYGIAVLGFDVVWAERDNSSGIETLDLLARKDLKQTPAFVEAYQKLRPGLDYDGLFAQAIKGRPVVLGYYFNSEEGAVKANAIPGPVLPKGTFASRKIDFQRYYGYTGNLPVYLGNAAGAGHFNPRIDDDGVWQGVVLVNSPIHKIQDLKGKRIGVPGMGTPPFVFANRVLGTHGVDPSTEIEWKVFPAGELGLALSKGEVDAVANAEPIGTLLIAQGTARNVEGMDEATDEPYASEYCCEIIANGKWIDANPDSAARATRCARRLVV